MLLSTYGTFVCVKDGLVERVMCSLQHRSYNSNDEVSIMYYYVLLSPDPTLNTH